MFGKKLDVFFYARSPYDINSTFRFDSTVATGNVTPPDPRVAANVNTLPLYSLSNTERIVADDVISNTAAAEHVAAYFPARAQLARRAAQWQAGAEVAFTLDDALAAVALAEAIVTDAETLDQNLT